MAEYGLLFMYLKPYLDIHNTSLSLGLIDDAVGGGDFECCMFMFSQWLKNR